MIDLHHRLYSDAYGESPAVSAKEGRQSKELIKRVGLDRTLAKVERAFKDRESLWFCKGTCISLGTILAHVNDIPTGHVTHAESTSPERHCPRCEKNFHINSPYCPACGEKMTEVRPAQ